MLRKSRSFTFKVVNPSRVGVMPREKGAHAKLSKSVTTHSGRSAQVPGLPVILH